MKRPDALPPRFDYTNKSDVERRIFVQFALMEIKAEFALFKRTGNGAHMWRCYQLWRRRMPDELPLPQELLEYFDQCAEGVATETTPEAIKRALQLTKEPGWMADHGGGPSGESAAKPTRQKRDAMQYICTELLKARTLGKPRGYKGEIYKAAAKKFGYSVSHIQRLLREWPVAELVERQYQEWLNVQRPK